MQRICIELCIMLIACAIVFAVLGTASTIEKLSHANTTHAAHYHTMFARSCNCTYVCADLHTGAHTLWNDDTRTTA